MPDILKEVLQVHTTDFIWEHYASQHFAGIDVVPDFTPYKIAKKALCRKGDARDRYLLDSIVQGSCAGIADQHIFLGDGNVPTCRHCQLPVTGCAVANFAYRCSITCNLEHEGIAGTRHLVEQAQVELEARPALWLRGLFPLNMPDPLNEEFSFVSSYDHLNVTGCVLAGDGSGGRNSRDCRTRRCGFGLVIIEANTGEGILGNGSISPQVLGYASGSVPGKQTTPRAEAIALLFALLTTIGSAIYVCDNLGVVQRFRNLRSNNIKTNGLLWSRIGKASRQRSESGNGLLEVVWLPSHITFETSMNRGYSSSYWVANQLTDKLAGDAAARYQLEGHQLSALADSTNLACSILQRLVGVMSHLASSATSSTSLGSLVLMEPRVPKNKQVEDWAREAGHAMDSHQQCVKCHLKLNMSRNLAYLKQVLTSNALVAKIAFPGLSCTLSPWKMVLRIFSTMSTMALVCIRATPWQRQECKNCISARTVERMVQLGLTI